VKGNAGRGEQRKEKERGIGGACKLAAFDEK